MTEELNLILNNLILVAYMYLLATILDSASQLVTFEQKKKTGRVKGGGP